MRTCLRAAAHWTGVAVLASATVLMAGAAAAVFALHLGFAPILTGSMRPTFYPGSLILTRSIPVQQVRPGDIVVFRPPGLQAIFAHRVRTVSGPPDHPTITTKGDANSAPDPWHAQLTGKTVPEVIASVPWVGRLVVALRGSRLRVLAVALLGLAACWAGTTAILGRPGGGRHRRPAPARP